MAAISLRTERLSVRCEFLPRILVGAEVIATWPSTKGLGEVPIAARHETAACSTCICRVHVDGLESHPLPRHERPSAYACRGPIGTQ